LNKDSEVVLRGQATTQNYFALTAGLPFRALNDVLPHIASLIRSITPPAARHGWPASRL
jgi:hypothetical protein